MRTRVATLNVKNFTNEGLHRECVLWLWEKFVEDWVCQRYLESIIECDQRQSIELKCDTRAHKLVLSKVCIIHHSNNLWPNSPRLTSQCLWANSHGSNRMGSNMCMVSPLNEGYGLNVVTCNICGIMCAILASIFFPCHDTLAKKVSHLNWIIWRS